MSARRYRLLGLRIALMLAVLTFAYQVLIPFLGVRNAREKMNDIREKWALAFTQKSGDQTTYAAVVLPDGATESQKTRALVWREYLTSGGIPVPAILTEEENLDETGFRFIVTVSKARLDAEALAASGRGVVVVQSAGPLNGTLVKWKDRDWKFPILGQAGSPLTPKSSDEVLMVSDIGEVLAFKRRVGNGVVIYLGIDIASHFHWLRQGTPDRVKNIKSGKSLMSAPETIPQLPLEFTEHPFADIFLEELLSTLDADLKCPLYRTRGLPENRPVVVLTSDQDYVDDEIVLHLAKALEIHNARATFMVTHPGVGATADINVRPEGAPLISSNTVDELLSSGHGMGIHPFVRVCADVRAMAETIQAHTGSRPICARNHWLRWPGDLCIPRVEAETGILLDLNYMFVCEGAKPCVGFPAGTTKPLPFISYEGELIPVLQQTTAVDDYSLRELILTDRPDKNHLLQSGSEALAAEALKALASAFSVEGPLVVNSHPAIFEIAPHWLNELIKSGAMVISAESWLDFCVNRRLTKISSPTCEHPPKVSLAPGVYIRTDNVPPANEHE